MLTMPEPPADSGSLRPPRQRRSQRSLDRLMLAAETLIVTGGIKDLTIADLLRESGVSNGTFYARFPGKDALLQEVQDRVLNRLEAAMAEQCAALAGPAVTFPEAVAGVVRALAAQFQDHAALLRNLMRQGATDPVMQARAARTRARIEQLFAEVVARRVPRGAGPALSRAVAVAHGVLTAVLIERVSADQSVPVESWRAWDVLVEEMVRLLVAYLASPETSAGTAV